METPRYRLRADDAVNGLGERAGYEFDFTGWPKPTFEPLNEPARRIAAYATKHQFDPYKPDVPLARGSYYLPYFTTIEAVRESEHVIPNGNGGFTLFRGQGYRPLPTTDLPGMPKYRLRAQARFGNAIKEAGEVVAYLSWPLGSSLDPVNDEARQVVAYLREWIDHPKLPPCPWNDFTDSIDLPDPSGLPMPVPFAPAA
jgi:hypothetical protein